MKRKNSVFLFIVFIVVVLFVGGVLWYAQKVKREIAEVAQKQSEEIKKEQETKQEEKNEKDIKKDEIASIQDLIDGEYIPKPVDISDWQTYRNEELGFEMKMPRDWILADTYIEKDPDIQGDNFYFGKKNTTYTIPEGGKSSSAIIISSSNRYNKKAMPLRDFIQLRKSDYAQKLHTFSLNGIEAIILGSDSVYFFNGDRVWDINFQLHHDNSIHAKEYDVFLGIVNTFKFIEQVQIADTSSWKTYRNEKFGYQVMYPQETKPVIIPSGEKNSTDDGHIIDFQLNDFSVRVDALKSSHEGKTIDEFVDSKSNVGDPLFSDNIENREEKIIQGERAFQFKSNPFLGMQGTGEMYQTINTLISGNVYYYQIISNIPASSGQKAKDLYDAFVNSFQLIE